MKSHQNARAGSRSQRSSRKSRPFFQAVHRDLIESGASVSESCFPAALRVANRLDPSATLVTIACDPGLRNLCTDVFRAVDES